MTKAAAVLVGFEAALARAKEDLQRETEWAAKYDDGDDFRNKELANAKQRVKDLRRLWKKFQDRPYIQKMDEIVRKVVERYHQDFYYHDLKIMDEYEGRFGWSVGDCGTHFVMLDVEDEEHAEHSRSTIKALKHSYGGYTVYEVYQAKGTIKKTTYDNLTARILSRV